jgi:hypothetical protein
MSANTKEKQRLYSRQWRKDHPGYGAAKMRLYRGSPEPTGPGMRGTVLILGIRVKLGLLRRVL